MIQFKRKENKAAEIKKVLHPIVEKWFFNRFEKFSLPQLYGVMEIHSRNNILVSAPTGATKTLTGFLSILNELIDSSEKGILEDRVYCVYVSPLKALSNDVSLNLKEPLAEMEAIAKKKLGIRVAVRTGDTTPSEKSRMLKSAPHILITTPESLAILLASPKFSQHLMNVEWCIVDEVHALADSKRGVHLSLSMENLGNMSPHMTRIGLSATVAPLEEIAKFLVGYEDGKERNCKIVDVQFIKELNLKVLSPVPDLIDTTHAKMHRKMYDLMHKLIQDHKTTLIFTNTRAATERVVHNLKEWYPKSYYENIGAHHGSLSAEHRKQLEQRLRDGKLKCVVCSTSLELGIDIGFIDLVILLGSPKSVARALQRVGRSGHKLHDTTKGRIIVLDRDDLVECSVLLKYAVDKKIDRIHIPTNCLDVLAQQLIGFSLQETWEEKELFELVKKSYCYHDLTKKDFNDILKYLAGEFVSLEDRHVYAKIWRNKGKLGRRGKMTRVIYMTNIGTIPDESFILVKVGEQTVGKIDEGFLERLRPGDVFVLGGEVYQFKFARGQTVQVSASINRPPTVPQWVSEMLPLSFDLACEIGKFRRLMLEKFSAGKSEKEIIDFILKYLYVDKNGAQSIYNYIKEQYDFASVVPTEKNIVIEHYTDEKEDKKLIFHSLFGRRVNDCLSRAIALAISRTYHKDVEIGINDNGFYISCDKKISIMNVLKLIKTEKLNLIMSAAIDKSEVFNRRFRHCASRALMILRNYKGRRKRVGRQQVSSMILRTALRRIDPQFSILKEAKREVLEDLMDIENTRKVIEGIEEGKIKITEIHTRLPSPFAFNIALMGYMDILKIEDKMEFLKRMHEMVRAKIGLGKYKGLPKFKEEEEPHKEFG